MSSLRWNTNRKLPFPAAQDQVLEAYREEVDRIVKEFGFKSIDVVSLTPDNEEKGAFLCK